ncbi:hypothetical protein BLSTO_01577 [Blastocystis sp. subtype 1]
MDSALIKNKLEYAAESVLFQNIKSKSKPYSFNEEGDSIICIAYRSDGRFIASTHSDHSVRITNVLTGNTVASLYGHLRTPWTVKWHPTKPNILASGCLGSKLIVWDIYKERAFKFAFIGDNQSIDSIDFHPTQDILIATCYDSVFLWEYEKSDTPICIVHKPNKAVLAALFAGGGELLLVGSKDVINNEFQETGIIEEYLLDVRTHAIISRPITLSTNAVFCNDHGMSISNCGMFLLLVIAAPQEEQPKYCIGGYHGVKEMNVAAEDISERQTFSQIMQQSLCTEQERTTSVDSSKKGTVFGVWYWKDALDASQYGFAKAAGCDLGVGRVKSRLAILSLDPESKGAILEFINIRYDASVICAHFNPSNHYILLCTEDNFLHYVNGVSEQHGTLRVLQSATWKVVYEKTFVNYTPNSADWNPKRTESNSRLPGYKTLVFAESDRIDWTNQTQYKEQQTKQAEEETETDEEMIDYGVKMASKTVKCAVRSYKTREWGIRSRVEYYRNSVKRLRETNKKRR